MYSHASAHDLKVDGVRQYVIGEALDLDLGFCVGYVSLLDVGLAFALDTPRNDERVRRSLWGAELLGVYFCRRLLVSC